MKIPQSSVELTWGNDVCSFDEDGFEEGDEV
jgi:hypothetical protein